MHPAVSLCQTNHSVHSTAVARRAQSRPLPLGAAGQVLFAFASIDSYPLMLVARSVAESALLLSILLPVACTAGARGLHAAAGAARPAQGAAQAQSGILVPQAHSGEIVGMSGVGEFMLSYWKLTVSCIVVYGCVPWNNIGSAFMQAQYDFSTERANPYLMIRI